MATSPSRATLADPLDGGNISALAAGKHGAPFDVLGPHTLTLDGQRVWLVRTYQPGAEGVSLIPTSASGATTGKEPEAIPMQRLHPSGLFSLVLPGEPPLAYTLDVHFPFGFTRRVFDPYAFPPVLSDYDLYLIGEGTHLKLWERLGAHPTVVDGVAGVAFAVWAPTARRVSVVGEFNDWNEGAHPMRLRANGIWELFIPELQVGALYKYAILSWAREYRVQKSDPFAFWAEQRPSTASRVADLGTYSWGDEHWDGERPSRNAMDAPINIYEVHAGSWRAPSEGGQVTYRDLAHQLVPYVKEMGYTHIELLPVAEYPFDGSWGYQVVGYYAPTSRYGTPQDFMYFVDYCHQHGIGVILDWVPAHFPRDDHGLAFFDGSHLYEHEDPRQGSHPDWGTLIFNYGRNEVRNFFIANALFWFEVYHVDGLRVDAVASMLYLDYSRGQGEWVANRYGGRENLDAIDFLRECNRVVGERHPDVLMVAEESTAWPGVTKPVDEGGLGFTLKWNMGWMHDTLEYFKHDPVHRRYHHNTLTFSMIYAYSERYVLPFSHDEVVHMKGSMLDKMPGDVWQKFANLRALYGYMYGHPGKKLLFMGGEFGQWEEWRFSGYLQWTLLDQGPLGSPHAQLQRYVRDLNHLLLEHPALYEVDFSPEGFSWIHADDYSNSVIAFVRYRAGWREPLIFVCNLTPVPRYRYRMGVPLAGTYEEVLNSDAAIYGGSNVGNLGHVETEPVPLHGHEQSLSLTLPPLATIVLKPESAQARQDATPARTRKRSAKPAKAEAE
jgi:1,4-alpha-glucan branching enzyme